MTRQGRREWGRAAWLALLVHVACVAAMLWAALVGAQWTGRPDRPSCRVCVGEVVG